MELRDVSTEELIVELFARRNELFIKRAAKYKDLTNKICDIIGEVNGNDLKQFLEAFNFCI